MACSTSLYLLISSLLLQSLSMIGNVEAAIPDKNSSVHERVITNIDDVYNGVPVDFKYNESDTSARAPAGGRLSVPGCPKSVLGYPWVYYGSPMKCYLAGERGPCDPDQKLFVEYGSQYGFCNCECFEGAKRSGDGDDVEFCFSKGKEYVFIPKMKKCFALYDQGHCSSNEWLVKAMDKNNRNITRCESRKCPEGEAPYFDNDELNTTTTSTTSRNFTCFGSFSAYGSPVSIIANECDNGMKYSDLLNKCVKKFAFNFGRK